MRAAVVPSLTGPHDIEVRDVPDVTAAPDGVLVRVHAVAPAFPDVLMCQGKYQLTPPVPYVALSDFAGTVVTAPADSGFAEGDRVAGFVDYGAAAELVAAKPEQLFPLPDEVSFEAGAALPLNYMTAHFALAIRGQVEPGDWVLVHGAAGGLGSAATQVACALGARVIAVTSSPEKAEAARRSGATHAIGRDDLSKTVRELTDGQGVHVVFDVVGGDATESLRSLRPLGRLLIVGFTSGEIPSVRVNRLLLTNTDVRGVEWGLMIDTGRTREQWDLVMRWMAEGAIAPDVTTVAGLDSIHAAMARLGDRAAIGRTVIAL